MLLGNKVYDVLKFLAQIVIPALGALYFGLASIWNLPNAEEVVGTVTVVDTFLGVLLGISSRTYNTSDKKYAGDIDVKYQMDGPTRYLLNLNSDPEELGNQGEITFKINSPRIKPSHMPRNEPTDKF